MKHGIYIYVVLIVDITRLTLVLAFHIYKRVLPIFKILCASFIMSISRPLLCTGQRRSQQRKDRQQLNQYICCKLIRIKCIPIKFTYVFSPACVSSHQQGAGIDRFKPGVWKQLPNSQPIFTTLILFSPVSFSLDLTVILYLLYVCM